MLNISAKLSKEAQGQVNEILQDSPDAEKIINGLMGLSTKDAIKVSQIIKLICKDANISLDSVSGSGGQASEKKESKSKKVNVVLKYDDHLGPKAKKLHFTKFMTEFLKLENVPNSDATKVFKEMKSAHTEKKPILFASDLNEEEASKVIKSFNDRYSDGFGIEASKE